MKQKALAMTRTKALDSSNAGERPGAMFACRR